MDTKKDIFQEHLREWLKAKGNKQQRGTITAHIVFVTKMHPKSISRKFKTLQLRPRAWEDTRGRPIYYGHGVTAALEDIWKATDEVCGELLHPMIREYVEILERDGMWQHSDEATGKLLAMSERTVKRRVREFLKARRGRGGRSSTSPSALKHIIPIFKGPWDKLPPGKGQLDTVAHCGDTLAGSFVYTVNYIDAASYWNTPRAQWNKGQEATIASMEDIVARTPFPITMMHPDSGSEFINWNAKKWCDGHSIDLTRSEPYRKNDNMYVEERNGHVVRKCLGYTRYDTPEIVSVINELYVVLALHVNHFRAVRRMVTKERVGAKYRRVYEKVAKTPYQRVLEHNKVPEAVKVRLREHHATLNPLLLTKEIARLKSKINEIQKASRNRGMIQ